MGVIVRAALTAIMAAGAVYFAIGGEALYAALYAGVAVFNWLLFVKS
ncbi:MAG: hypothetical protein HYT21_00940 [Candidatus Nealsonbacteria bacterium]|nr:hypothetical protein [Candidatus Nealsonbacteria bacterium]